MAAGAGAPGCGEYNRKNALARQIYTIRRGRLLPNYHIWGCKQAKGWRGFTDTHGQNSGEHTRPRVLVSAPRRNKLVDLPRREQKKFVIARARSPAREACALPRIPSFLPTNSTTRPGLIAALLERNTKPTQSGAQCRFRRFDA